MRMNKLLPHVTTNVMVGEGSLVQGVLYLYKVYRQTKLNQEVTLGSGALWLEGGMRRGFWGTSRAPVFVLGEDYTNPFALGKV